MDCQQAAALISARIDGELNDADGARLKDHLAECPGCWARAESLSRQDGALWSAFGPSRRAGRRFTERLAVRVPATARAAGRKRSLLLVDDRPDILALLRQTLSDDFEVVTAGSAVTACGLLERRPFDLMLADLEMPPGWNGVQLLEWAYQHRPQTVRMLMTGHGEVADIVSAINRGHIFSFVQKPWRQPELEQVLREAVSKLEEEEALRRREEELSRLASQRGRELEEAHAQLLQRKRELERLALNDPLTGLLNRRSVEELARFELKRHTRYPTAVALGAIDIDGFNRVNRDHYYLAGDAVLVGLARTLTRSVRETDSVGRVGGEEFLVVARETNEAGAIRLAERIRSTVAGTPVLYEGKPISVTVSVGFAVAEPGALADFPAMAEAAWSAVRQAKVEGRNRVAVRRVEGRRAV